MTQKNLVWATLGVLALLPGCASSGADSPGAAGSSSAGQGGAAAGSSTGGLGGDAAGQTVVGGAGSAGVSSGGAGGVAGVSATGGTPVGGAGGASGGTGGAGGTPAVGKGASGKAVCQGLSGFSDPSVGIGSVSEVKAPQSSFFAFIEGPVWVASKNLLLFSDNAGSPERIWSYDLTTKMPTKFLEPSGSNGLAVDAQDRVLVADQANRAIYRLDPETKQKAGANLASGSYKPNDLVARSDGVIYFTDPDTGFYYLLAGSSEAKLVSSTGARPNGIVLTLDESALIVGDVGNQKLTKFAVAADGSVTAGGTAFGTTTGTTADGMCMDCAGNVYVGTQTGLEIFDPTGKRLGVVPTGESSNCTFGGPDRKTLFVTSRAVLKYVTLANPGLPN